MLAKQYVSKDDKLYKLANNIKPIDGYDDFLIHGQPNLVEYESKNRIMVNGLVLLPKNLQIYYY